MNSKVCAFFSGGFKGLCAEDAIPSENIASIHRMHGLWIITITITLTCDDMTMYVIINDQQNFHTESIWILSQFTLNLAFYPFAPDSSIARG